MSELSSSVKLSERRFRRDSQVGFAWGPLAKWLLLLLLALAVPACRFRQVFPLAVPSLSGRSTRAVPATFCFSSLALPASLSPVLHTSHVARDYRRRPPSACQACTAPSLVQHRSSRSRTSPAPPTQLTPPIYRPSSSSSRSHSCGAVLRGRRRRGSFRTTPSRVPSRLRSPSSATARPVRPPFPTELRTQLPPTRKSETKTTADPPALS